MSIDEVRKLPMATKEQNEKYMEAGLTFVQDQTSIPVDTVRSLAQKMPVPAALAVAEMVIYMAVYAVAEQAAQKDGLTLRDWEQADRGYAAMDAASTIITDAPKSIN